MHPAHEVFKTFLKCVGVLTGSGEEIRGTEEEAAADDEPRLTGAGVDVLKMKHALYHRATSHAAVDHDDNDDDDDDDDGGGDQQSSPTHICNSFDNCSRQCYYICRRKC